MAITRIASRTARLPRLMQAGVTLAMVGGCFVLRDLSAPLWPNGVPFLLLFLAVLVASSLFPRGAGYLATLASALRRRG